MVDLGKVTWYSDAMASRPQKWEGLKRRIWAGSHEPYVYRSYPSNKSAEAKILAILRRLRVLEQKDRSVRNASVRDRKREERAQSKARWLEMMDRAKRNRVDPLYKKAASMRDSARKRANAGGLPFSISVEDVATAIRATNGVCPITNLPFKGDQGGQAPSLDKVIPALGYTPANTRVISIFANTMKNNATPEMIHNLWQYVRDAIK